MKGITPVIAIILLLLITISMVGFAFVWFSRVQSNIQSSTEQSVNIQMDNMNKLIRIDYANTTAIYIRNMGSKDINSTADLSIYVDGINRACLYPIGILAAGATKECTIANSTITTTCTGVVKIIAPGNTDEQVCT